MSNNTEQENNVAGNESSENVKKRFSRLIRKYKEVFKRTFRHT